MPTRVAGREALPALDDPPDDLVAGDERKLRVGQLAVHDVEVGAADAAHVHVDEHLPGAGLGHGQLGLPEGRPRGVEHHRPHRATADPAGPRLHGR